MYQGEKVFYKFQNTLGAVSIRHQSKILLDFHLAFPIEKEIPSHQYFKNNK